VKSHLQSLDNSHSVHYGFGMTPKTEAPITVREFAARTGISYRLAWELIDKGEIAHLVIPSRAGARGLRRNVRIEPREVAAFIGRARNAAKTA